MRRSFFMGGFLLIAVATQAQAQLPIQVSVGAGLAIPISTQKDVYENGLHVGIGVKLPMIPLQLEGGYDKMAAISALNDDISIVSGGVALKIPVTPPLLPVGAYLVGGAGVYRTEAETSATDVGVNGGVGVRVGVPGISLFGEGRGVVVLSEVSKVKYITAAIGIRF
jgi:hypothetical protein